MATFGPRLDANAHFGGPMSLASATMMQIIHSKAQMSNTHYTNVGPRPLSSQNPDENLTACCGVVDA